MIIEATEILKLFHRADKIGATYDIKQKDDGFEIKLYYTWHENDYYHTAVFITQEGDGSDEKGDLGFYDMMHLLDEKLEEQKQKEIKAQKRKELIARFTDEEKELLGVK
jgi:hypothetical protein